MKPKLKDPGPISRRATVLLDAVSLARETPGEWVLARTYKNHASAYVTGTRLRKRFPDMETTARKGELFVRTAVEA